MPKETEEDQIECEKTSYAMAEAEAMDGGVRWDELCAKVAAVYGKEIPREQIDNKPPRYNAGDIECIDAIEAALTPEEFRGFCKGNALKYVWRESHKGGDHDLGKAHYYLNKAKK